MAALASAHDGTLGTDDTGRARQCTRQFVQLLLAREAMVAGTNICRCVFVHHSDVIFHCNLKKHGSLLFSGTASRCPDHIHHSAANGKQVQPQPQNMRKWPSNLYLWDWTLGAHISLRSGMFHHLKVVSITAAKRASKEEPLPRG
jgi:hypothetical protein